MLRNAIKLVLLKKYNQNALYSDKKFHISVQRLAEEELQTVDKYEIKINNLLTKYSTEQKEEMLKIINNYNLNDLLGYQISKGRANKLLAWRTRHGLLKNLNEVISVESFGIKVADKFFQSLLLEPKTKKLGNGQAKTTSFITPSIEAEQRQSIKTCCSVRIGVNSITWSCVDIPEKDINVPCLLTHWQHEEISDKKLHINELIQRCLYVQHCIPTADCYLFENPQLVQASTNPGSVEQQNINVQKAQVTAVIGYALACRNNHLVGITVNGTDKITKYLPNLFYVRRFLTARLFNHLVGTERVSSEQTILNMMRTFYNTNDEQDFLPAQQDLLQDNVQDLNDNEAKLSGRVQFPMELRQMFSKAPPYYREFLGQTLLLNLAFVRLILLQDPLSIATVSRGNRRNSSVSDSNESNH